MKLAVVRVFTPQKLADTANQLPPPNPDPSQLLNIYQLILGIQVQSEGACCGVGAVNRLPMTSPFGIWVIGLPCTTKRGNGMRMRPS